MTERGGPTTQAGINYQNRVAALYLGDLLRFDSDDALRVVAVRVEAPAKVDDIVISFADGSHHWIQAKLALSTTSAAWVALWKSFHSQIGSPDFNGGDRLRLVLGEDPDLARILSECAGRTSSSLDGEWRSRLTASQLELVENVEGLIGRSAYQVFRNLDVERLSESDIDESVGQRLPTSNQQPESLLLILQSIAAARSRRRQRFTVRSLRTELRYEYGVRLDAPFRWGLSAYLTSVRSANISVPGTAIGGSVGEAFHWPRAVRSRDTEVDFEDEQSFGRWEQTAEEFDLRLFPTTETTQCIVHAGPGFGKSTLLLAVADRVVKEAEYVPALVPLSDLSDTCLEVLQYLKGPLNESYSVSIDWTRLCETGMAMLLLDGLDEVPLSQRSAVVQKLERFARRFPTVPWILTVRDTAVLPAGFDAEKIELWPLTKTDMTEFARAVHSTVTARDAERLIDRVMAYPELERLVRIPLFLALLLATWVPGDPVPTRRTDLIEAYLKTLFRPEEHKNALRSGDPELLREAMQDLAYQLLETGEVGAPERFVRKLIATHATAAVTAERLYDDALRCGILKRPASGRLSFPFPIVQEYLAGQQLVERHFQDIAIRATKAVQRPWAQAVQFALERVPDGDQIARMLLDISDDAFATSLRLLGRCIVNGMPCSPEVRELVGERLARAWPRQSFWTAKRVGQLIDDGWSSPPGPAVRTALHRRDLRSDGAAEILARLQDDELSYSVLSSYLKRPRHIAHLGAFQTAVDRIPAKAFNVYLDAVRSGACGHDSWAVATLIGRLNPNGIDRTNLLAVAGDTSLPRGIKLAAMGLVGGTPTPEFWALANDALRDERDSEHWAAVRALRWMQEPTAYLASMLRNTDLPAHAHGSIVDHLGDVLPHLDNQLDFIKGLLSDRAISSGIRVRLRIRAADLGLRTAFETLLDEFSDLSTYDAGRCLWALGQFPEKSIGERAISAMRARCPTREEQVQFASHFLSGATYKFENPGYTHGATVPIPKHPSFPDLLALLEEWYNEAPGDLATELAMATMAARYGVSGAIDRLRELACIVIKEHSTLGHENPLNHGIRSAMDVLGQQRMYLDLSLTIILAENTDSNAEIGAFAHIGAIGTRAALDYLIARSKDDRENHSTIFNAIEKVSGRLGLKVVEAERGYQLA